MRGGTLPAPAREAQLRPAFRAGGPRSVPFDLKGDAQPDADQPDCSSAQATSGPDAAIAPIDATIAPIGVDDRRPFRTAPQGRGRPGVYLVSIAAHLMLGVALWLLAPASNGSAPTTEVSIEVTLLPAETQAGDAPTDSAQRDGAKAETPVTPSAPDPVMADVAPPIEMVKDPQPEAVPVTEMPAPPLVETAVEPTPPPEPDTAKGQPLPDPVPVTAEVMPEPARSEPVVPEPVIPEPDVPETVVPAPPNPEPAVPEAQSPEPVEQAPTVVEPLPEPVAVVSQPQEVPPLPTITPVTEPARSEPVIPDPVAPNPVVPEPQKSKPAVTTQPQPTVLVPPPLVVEKPPETPKPVDPAKPEAPQTSPMPMPKPSVPPPSKPERPKAERPKPDRPKAEPKTRSTPNPSPVKAEAPKAAIAPRGPAARATATEARTAGTPRPAADPGVGAALFADWRSRVQAAVLRARPSPDHDRPGRVGVSFTIGKAGNLMAATVSAPSGMAALDAAALAAVRRAAPFPPIPDGSAAPASLTVTIRFQIDD